MLKGRLTDMHTTFSAYLTIVPYLNYSIVRKTGTKIGRKERER